jgi:hypothetical protein
MIQTAIDNQKYWLCYEPYESLSASKRGADWDGKVRALLEKMMLIS